MKKFMSTATVSMLTVALLASCGSETSTEQTTSGDDVTETSELDGEIKVGVFGTPTELSTYRTIADGFTEETGVEVEFRQYTDFNTEFQAEVIGGTAPDVFMLDSYMFPFYAEQGVLAETNTSLYDMEQYSENLLSAFQYDGVQYAMPKDYSTLALYYNTDYVNPVDAPTSYEELAPYLEELSTTLPEGVVPMTYNIDLARQMYVAQSNGDKIVNPETGLAQFSNENVAKNLSYEYDMAQDGLVYTPADLGLGWNGEVFGTGKTAIMLEGNWVAGELDNNYPDINYATAENFTLNGEKGSMLFTVGWAINAASENISESEAYVQYVSNAENTELASIKNGTLPARADVIEKLELSTHPIFGSHIRASEYATPWQAGNTLDTINIEFMNYMPSVATGERTIEDALQIAENEANKIIEAN